ncbi:MAG: hypothetical protein K6F58_07460 [Bacteroidales bacterium]|nr:hypothetical protein [Bacteroidales bacterium]
MEGISVPVVYKYKKVAAVTSGKKYIMTYTDEDVVYMATVLSDQTKSFGYYYTQIVEPEEDVITLANEDNTLVITQSGDGWLIQFDFTFGRPSGRPIFFCFIPTE